MFLEFSTSPFSGAKYVKCASPKILNFLKCNTFFFKTKCRFKIMFFYEWTTMVSCSWPSAGRDRLRSGSWALCNNNQSIKLQICPKLFQNYWFSIWSLPSIYYFRSRVNFEIPKRWKCYITSREGREFVTEWGKSLFIEMLRIQKKQSRLTCRRLWLQGRSPCIGAGQHRPATWYTHVVQAVPDMVKVLNAIRVYSCHSYWLVIIFSPTNSSSVLERENFFLFF